MHYKFFKEHLRPCAEASASRSGLPPACFAQAPLPRVKSQVARRGFVFGECKSLLGMVPTSYVVLVAVTILV